MTEEEWLKCSQPRRMLDHIYESASRRKLMLFSCASCRRVWEWIADPRSRQALAIAERSADGLASAAERRQAKLEAERACIAGEDLTARSLRAVYAAVHAEPLAVNHQL